MPGIDTETKRDGGEKCIQVLIPGRKSKQGMGDIKMVGVIPVVGK